MKPLSKKQEKRRLTINKRINTVAKLWALLFFSVFVLAVKGYSDITRVKYICFLTLSLSFVIYYIYEKGSLFLENPTLKRPTLKQNLPYIFLGSYLVFNMLSCLFSPYVNLLNSNKQSLLIFGSGRYDGIFTLFLCLALFVAFSFENVFTKSLVNIISASTLLVVLVGAFQLLGVNIFGLYPQGNYFTNKRNFISTLGNIDIVSTYLVIALGILAFSYIGFCCKKIYSYIWLGVYGLGFLFLFEINVDSGKVAIVLLLSIALVILSSNKQYFIKLLDVCSLSALCFGVSCLIEFQKNGITLTGGKTAWFSFALAVVVFCIRLVYCKMQTKSNSRLWVYILLIEIVSLVVALIFILNYKGDNETLIELSEILKFNFSDDFGNERIGVWKYTLMLIKKRLVLGFGTGTYRFAFSEFLEQAAPHFTEKTYDFAHNEYLQILYNCGVLGLASYLGFIVTVFINGLKAMTHNPKTMILVFAVCGYLIQAFFTFSIIIVSPLFWLMSGMLVAESRNTN